MLPPLTLYRYCLQILASTAHGAGAETTRALADLKFMLNSSGRYGLSGAEKEAVTEAIGKMESKKVGDSCADCPDCAALTALTTLTALTALFALIALIALIALTAH